MVAACARTVAAVSCQVQSLVTMFAQGSENAVPTPQVVTGHWTMTAMSHAITRTRKHSLTWSVHAMARLPACRSVQILRKLHPLLMVAAMAVAHAYPLMVPALVSPVATVNLLAEITLEILLLVTRHVMGLTHATSSRPTLQSLIIPVTATIVVSNTVDQGSARTHVIAMAAVPTLTTKLKTIHVISLENALCRERERERVGTNALNLLLIFHIPRLIIASLCIYFSI
jgi:hypothetical protein